MDKDAEKFRERLRENLLKASDKVHNAIEQEHDLNSIEEGILSMLNKVRLLKELERIES